MARRGPPSDRRRDLSPPGQGGAVASRPRASRAAPPRRAAHDRGAQPEGRAHKTTSTLLLAATFGTQRGGATLAWDNNETRGTLGWRAQNAPHHRTAVDLLEDLDRSTPDRASLAALDTYVRTQVDARFDVLASDEDAAASSTIDATAFDRLHDVLSRYYRLLIVDTGNNMRASNWVAAVAAADQLVIVSTVREDTAASAAWLLDGCARRASTTRSTRPSRFSRPRRPSPIASSPSASSATSRRSRPRSCTCPSTPRSSTAVPSTSMRCRPRPATRGSRSRHPSPVVSDLTPPPPAAPRLPELQGLSRRRAGGRLMPRRVARHPLQFGPRIGG
jgi:hypothetical protein